jgi:hypothetical protein
LLPALLEDGDGRARLRKGCECLVPLYLLSLKICADTRTQARSNDFVELFMKRTELTELLIVSRLLVERGADEIVQFVTRAAPQNDP